MGDFLRGHSNPLALDQAQDNPYGVPADKAPGPISRDHDVGKGHNSYSRATVSHEVQNGTSIIAARDDMGSPVSLDGLQDSTVVTIDGVGEMTYASAKQAGFVTASQVARVTGGQQAPQPSTQVTPPKPLDITPPPQEPHRSSTESPSDGTEESFQGDNAEATEAAVTAFAQGTDADTQSAVIEEAVATGTLSDERAAQVAESIGADVAQVHSVREAFETQALEAVADAAGVDTEGARELVAEMYQEHPEAMSDAIRRHLTERSTAGYRDLATQLALDSAIDDGSLPQAGNGVSVRRDAEGNVVVGVAGREYDLRTAVKLGLVKISDGEK